MFKIKCASALSVALTLCFGGLAMANSLPPGTRAPTADQLAAAYAGKTDLWPDNCGGGIYYGANGTAKAWCRTNSENFASGQWSITSDGRLCTDLNWFWPNPNGGAGSSSGGINCILHASGPTGGLWRSWDGKDWWKMRPSTSGLKSGYVFRGDIERTRQRLGL